MPINRSKEGAALPRFFISDDQISGESIIITGDDARHISRSLRMRTGESITLCDGCGRDYFCTVKSITDETVVCAIERTESSLSEPSVKVTLYQGLPKGDKLDTIIKKCTELGVVKIVPVMMSRCVSRPDDKKNDKKTARWQKIAEEAAKQSGRGIIPKIESVISFDELIRRVGLHKKTIVFYENSREPFSEILQNASDDIAIIIGPEGGFEPEEIEALADSGANQATLGGRILRTETAGMAALAAIMFATGNLG